MLMLTRKALETIVIGHPPNQVTILVQKIEGDRVRIGIEAAREIPIRRGELEERIA